MFLGFERPKQNMTIALVQISDIHLREGDNPVLDRIQAVAPDLRTLQMPVTATYLLMPGDIAYSGKQAEYRVATGMITELLASIEREFPGSNPQTIFAPGNHDCDLTVATDVRDVEILKKRLETIDLHGATAGHFLAVQDEYFAFASQYGFSYPTAIEIGRAHV